LSTISHCPVTTNTVGEPLDEGEAVGASVGLGEGDDAAVGSGVVWASVGSTVASVGSKVASVGSTVVPHWNVTESTARTALSRSSNRRV